ncbi:tRNA 2-selenouridine(34) synthase MnmH [Paenibacillus sp. GCM10023252]|uniref:tRNA 2-selenouridine(34) synthase MnmH n=1 Tax=Paenibacillus sp. GCM10023252 TaxID=3252649 RepID=UPI00361F1232
MTFNDITVEELLELQRRGEIELIDVRSEAEYEDATIPGSVNIPIFNNEERALIGTIYKQESVEAAKDRGLEVVSAKLPAFMRAIGQTEKSRKAVFCWRGGMRSKTTATLASLLDYRMFRLVGGYRAYRKWVVERLEGYDKLQPCYVINGYTGTGKTELLNRLEALGYPVLNLERMAAHRGSIFGHVGLTPRNQKSFESELLHALVRLERAPYLIIEAESKRVGKAVLPEFLVAAKEQGRTINLEMPIEERVANILADYRPEEHKEPCMDAFKRIEKRIHTPVAAEIKQALQQDRFDVAVRLLLLNYYDERYQHASDQYGSEPITVKAAGVEEALEQLLALLPPPPAASQQA